MVRALETKFLLFWTRQERDSVLSQSPAPRSLQPVSLASPGPPAAVPPPTWPVPGLGLAVLVVTSTAAFPASAAVEGRQTERHCPFASGEASGSERLRLPPQVRSQPTHPVRQGITWHPEVNGDISVTPAVYDPALQQSAVAWVQFPEKGAKLITSHGLHWGDLGDHPTGFSVVGLIGGHRAAVANSFQK